MSQSQITKKLLTNLSYNTKINPPRNITSYRKPFCGSLFDLDYSLPELSPISTPSSLTTRCLNLTALFTRSPPASLRPWPRVSQTSGVTFPSRGQISRPGLTEACWASLSCVTLTGSQTTCSRACLEVCSSRLCFPCCVYWCPGAVYY